MLIFLLLVYLFVEISVSCATDATILTRLIIHFSIKHKTKKKLPAWWKIKEVDLFDIEREYKGKYICFLRIESKYGVSEFNTIITNKWGKIIDDRDIFNSVRHYDEHNKKTIIQLNRDSILDKLGI